MKILWNKNPLNTTIELDTDIERDLFKMRIKNEHYMWALVGIEYQLGKNLNKADTIKEIKNELWVINEPEKLKESIDNEYEMCLQQLDGIHCGDCTCVPSSCYKCIAEDFAGVNTIEGCGKHSLYKIDGVVGDNPDASMKELVEILDNPDYSVVSEHYRGHEDLWHANKDRWTEESKHAATWLRQYYKDHFGYED